MIAALSAGRDASKELRSRLAFTEADQRRLLESPRPGLGELAVLSTCHRTELYATGDGTDAELVHAMAGLLPGLQPTDQHELRFLQGAEAIEHLFRVACGLDSLVVGEPQVLGQVRRAMILAEESRALGPVLINIFQRAIRLGKLARAETSLGKIGASIGSIAIEYLTDRLGGLDGKNGLVVGAGEAARDAATESKRAGATLKIVSRTPAAAISLAKDLEVTPSSMETLRTDFEEADFAIVAVSGGIFIRAADLPAKFKVEPFPILDLSIPAAVDHTGRDEVDLRSLEDIPGPRGPQVTEAIIDTEAMVKREVFDLLQWADTRAAGPLIFELHQMAERLVNEEVSRAARSMNLAPEEEERIKALVSRIAAKLLHAPTAELRRADEETRAIVRRLFRLEG